MPQNKLMTRFVAVFLFLFYLHQTPSAQVNQIPFNPEENLKYSLFYSLGIISIPAGEIFFSSSNKYYNNRSVLCIEVLGKSLKSYEFIYSMNENIKTYADAQTLSPLWCELKMNQKGREYSENMRFEADKNKIYVENKDYNKPIKRDSCQNKSNTFDFLTAFYYIRSHNFSVLKPGNIIPLRVVSGAEIHNIVVKFICRENVCLPDSRTVKALKVAVGTIPGDIFNKGDEIIIWLSDDDKHVPLQFESKVLIGSVKAVIVNNSSLASLEVRK